MLALIANNLIRRPGRSLLTAVGVGLGVAVIVALLTLTQGLRDTAAGFIHLGDSDLGVFQAQVADPTASVLPQSLVGALDRRRYIAAATPLLLLVTSIPRQPSAIAFGADPDGFFMRRLVMVGGARPRGSRQVAVGDTLARQLHLRAGSSMQVHGRNLTVSGIYHSGIFFEDSGAVLPLGLARTLEGRTGEETSVAVDLAPGVRNSVAAKRIAHDFPGTEVIADAGEAARAGANNLLIGKAIAIFVVVALIVGGIAVTNTMAMAVLERQGEFALLSTVGWSSARVATLVVGEGLAVSIVGAGLGLLLGVLGSQLLVDALGVGAYVSPSVTAWGLGRGLLVGIAIGVLGGIYPAWRVTRMRPLKGLARA